MPIRRQIRDAERDIELSTRRIGEIGQDIARLVPTAGDAFAMTVRQAFTERKVAGRALMKEILTLVQLQHEARSSSPRSAASISYSRRALRPDGYRYATMLQRTGAEYEIELPVTVTPLGAIARLEHALANFEGEQENYRQRLADARSALPPIARGSAKPSPSPPSSVSSARNSPRSRSILPMTAIALTPLG